MSSFNDDHYRDEDETIVRDPVGVQHQQPQGAASPMPNHVQQQAYGQQPFAPQPYGYGSPQGYGYANPWGMRPRRQFPIETKPFFLTSEFVGAVLAIAGIAITAAASDAFGAWRAWILITAVVVGYMVSRGIAKSGTRSNADDPREHFEMNWGGGNDRRSGSQ